MGILGTEFPESNLRITKCTYKKNNKLKSFFDPQ